MDEITEDQVAQVARPPRRVQLTERDLEILRWIGEQSAARADQVARLLAQRAGPGLQVAEQLSRPLPSHRWSSGSRERWQKWTPGRSH